MISAIAYLRMSSIGQDTSIEQQRKRVREFARKHGYKIVKWYIDEGKSGSMNVEKRIDFMRMLGDAPDGKFSVVLCFDISRFGRLDSIEGAFAKKILRDAGVKLVTVMDGEIDWNTTTGRIIDSVLSEAQHDYSVRLGKKTLEGKLTTFQKGQSFGQKPAYGFSRRITDAKGESKIIPRLERFRRHKDESSVLVPGDADEVRWVKWMFQTFAKRDVGFRFLAAELNSQNVPSPTGRKWCGKVIQEMLQNEVYIGNLTLGRKKAGKFWRLSGEEVNAADGPKIERTKDVLRIVGTHEALVGPSLFEKVQLKIERRKTTKTHSHQQGGYALKDVLFCGQCGKPLYGNPNSNGNKSGRVKYVCKQAIKFGKQCECGQWGVFEDEVLPFLRDRLLAALDKETIRQASAHVPRKRKVDTKALERRIQKLDSQIERGTENLLLASKDNLPELDARLKQLKSERATIAQELATVAPESELVHPQQRAEHPSGRDELRRKREWYERMRDELIRLDVWKSESGKFSICTHVTRDAFRELLVSHGCRMEFWWDRKSKHRWKVCKIRLMVFGQQAQFGTLNSLMVWCGERKGRSRTSAWLSSSRPTAL